MIETFCLLFEHGRCRRWSGRGDWINFTHIFSAYEQRCADVLVTVFSNSLR